MTINRLVLFFFLFSITIQNFGQQSAEIINLKKLFLKEKSNKQKANIANKIVKQYLLNENDEFIDEAIKYVDLAIEFSKKVKIQEVENRALLLKSWALIRKSDLEMASNILNSLSADNFKNKDLINWHKGILGILYYRKNSYTKSLEYLLNAIVVASELNNAEQLAFFYRYVARCYAHLGNYNNAIEYYNSSTAQFKILGIRNGEYVNYKLLGNSYAKYSEISPNILDSNLIELGISNYKLALEYFLQTNDSKQLPWIYTLLADSYIKKQSLENALFYQQKCLDLAVLQNDSNLIGISYSNLGLIDFNKNKYNSALIHFQRAIKMYSLKTGVSYKIPAITHLAETYYIMGNYISALTNAQIALNLAVKEEEFVSESALHKLIYDIYRVNGNFKLANQHIVEYYELLEKNSISEKEHIISAFKSNKLFDSLELINQDLALRNEIQKNKSDKERTTLIFIVLILFISLILAIISILFYKKRQLLKGETKERKRIAKKLHDEVAADLASELMILEYEKQQDFKNIDLDNLINQIQRAYKSIRNLSHELDKLETLKKQNLEERIYDFIEKFKNIQNLKIELIIYPSIDWTTINLEIQCELFLIIKELIINVFKHSEATELEIQFTLDDEKIDIILEDNGIGFEPKEQNGLGLKNITDRINKIKGNMKIDSGLNQGTSIIIDIPIEFVKV